MFRFGFVPLLVVLFLLDSELTVSALFSGLSCRWDRLRGPVFCLGGCSALEAKAGGQGWLILGLAKRGEGRKQGGTLEQGAVKGGYVLFDDDDDVDGAVKGRYTCFVVGDVFSAAFSAFTSFLSVARELCICPLIH